MSGAWQRPAPPYGYSAALSALPYNMFVLDPPLEGWVKCLCEGWVMASGGKWARLTTALQENGPLCRDGNGGTMRKGRGKF